MRFTGFVGRPNLSRVGTAVCLCLQTVSSAGAQTTQWSDRAFLNVNVTLQLTARPFDEGLAPVIYAERAVLRTTHTGKAAS